MAIDITKTVGCIDKISLACRQVGRREVVLLHMIETKSNGQQTDGQVPLCSFCMYAYVRTYGRMIGWVCSVDTIRAYHEPVHTSQLCSIQLGWRDRRIRSLSPHTHTHTCNLMKRSHAIRRPAKRLVNPGFKHTTVGAIICWSKPLSPVHCNAGCTWVRLHLHLTSSPKRIMQGVVKDAR